MKSNLAFRLMVLKHRLRDLFRPPVGIVRETGIGPGMAVLDFGCGSGRFALAAARLVGAGGRVYALDLHPLAGEIVRRAARRKGMDHLLMIGSLDEIPPASLDMVLLYDVLHELPDPGPVLAGLHRVLKPGSILSARDRHLDERESASAVTAGGIEFVQGRLKVGHPLSPPLVRAVRRRAAGQGLTIVDCPPGTSCPVVAAVMGSDSVVLVAEPTPFGLHDLKLAVETVRALRLPLGVVVNRADAGDTKVFAYCAAEGIPVLLRLPEDRRIAEAYSRGASIVEALPGLRSAFAALLVDVTRTLTRVKEPSDAHL